MTEENGRPDLKEAGQLIDRAVSTGDTSELSRWLLAHGDWLIERAKKCDELEIELTNIQAEVDVQRLSFSV